MKISNRGNRFGACVLGVALAFVSVQGLTAAGRVSPVLPPDLDVRPPINLSVDLHSLPIAGEVLDGVMEGLAQKEIDLALVGGDGVKINDCLGIKLAVGKLNLTWGTPTFRIDADGVEISFAVEHVEMHAFSIRFRVPDPKWDNPLNCSWGNDFGVGGSASDIRFHFRFRPRVRLDDCQMASLGSFDSRLSIGNLNLNNVQNDLDRLMKNIVEDAATYALDQVLPNMIGEALNGAILSRICQTKVFLYELYMNFLGAGVSLHGLPEEYIQKLQHLFPNRDLHTVKFGYSGHQEPGNATTDCNRMYFGNAGFVERLRTATLVAEDFAAWSWLLHELRHTEHCVELGGREEYAKKWFKDLSTALLVTNLSSPAYFRVIHDAMPMEHDAIDQERKTAVVTGTVFEAGSAAEPASGVEVLVYAEGTAVGPSTPPVARAVSSPDGLAHSHEGEYFLFLGAGNYDVYYKAAGPGTPRPATMGLAIAVDANADDSCDLVWLDITTTSGPGPIPTPSAQFLRGNVSGEDAVDISDTLSILSWLFTGGAAPGCEKAADVNDDGNVDVSDALGLLNYLFLGGEEPAAPFRAPGTDPTEDDLTCERSSDRDQ